MIRYFTIAFYMILISAFACCSSDQRSKDISDQEKNSQIITLPENSSPQVSKTIQEKAVMAKNTEKEIRNKSEFVKSNCDVIVEKYEEAIELLRLNKSSDRAKTSIKSMRNDPIVRDCRKDEKYRKKFKKLDKKYYSLK